MTRRLNIMTAFLPRENLFFIEEWLLYHLRLGVDHVYFYNNAGSRWLNHGESLEVTGRNKHGVPVYQALADVSDAEVAIRLRRILAPYIAGGYATLIPWQPRTVTGEITFDQVGAYLDYYADYANTATWSAFIDLDEFLVTPLYGALPPLLADLDADGVDLVLMRQTGFANRFDASGEPVLAVTALTRRDAGFRGGWSGKSLVRSAALTMPPLPEPHRGLLLHNASVRPGSSWFTDDEVLRFHHYRYNRHAIARDVEQFGEVIVLDQDDDRAARHLPWIAATRHSPPGRTAGAVSDPKRAAVIAAGRIGPPAPSIGR